MAPKVVEEKVLEDLLKEAPEELATQYSTFRQVVDQFSMSLNHAEDIGILARTIAKQKMNLKSGDKAVQRRALAKLRMSRATLSTKIVDLGLRFGATAGVSAGAIYLTFGCWNACFTCGGASLVATVTMTVIGALASFIGVAAGIALVGVLGYGLYHLICSCA
jgi:hypothetical protein